MPHTITWEGTGAYVKFSGRVSIGNIHGMMEAIGADPCFDKLRYLLIDYLDVAEPDVTIDEVEVAAALRFAHGMTNPRYIHAAVARDPKILGLLQHFKSAVVHPERVAYFTSIGQAREWVDQNDPARTSSLLLRA